MITTHEATMTFEIASVEQEVLSLYFGGEPRPEPTFSLMYDHEHEASGEPVRPQRVRGLKAWLTRANAKAQRAYREAYQDWEFAGRPNRTVKTRAYIPRATLKEVNTP